MTSTAATARTHSEFLINAGNLTFDISLDETKERKRKDSSDGSPGYSHRRVLKRIAQACDRCRFKKARCTGGTLCFRCSEDGSVCVTTPRPHPRRHSVRSDYVSLIQGQRDQLYQAIAKILVEEDDIVSSRIQAVLQNMGISVNTDGSPGITLTDDFKQMPLHGSTNSVDETWSDFSDDISILKIQNSFMDPASHSMDLVSVSPDMDVLYNTTDQDWSTLSWMMLS